MAGGFTKYNKLEVADLGTEGTGDRIALFNSDGRLIGYVLKESLENFVPLSGTEVGKPMDGIFEIASNFEVGFLQVAEDDSIENVMQFNKDEGIIYESFLYDNLIDKNIQYRSNISVNPQEVGLQSINSVDDYVVNFSIGDTQANLQATNPLSRGIRGDKVYDKQNDPNAFAQMGDVQDATGHASYTDTAYSVGSPLTLLAGVDTVLPNNSGVIYDDEKPDDIATFYNGTTITGRDGDGLAIMIYFKATPSTINSELDIWIDIGGGIGELYRQTIYFRGATEKGVLYALPAAYTRATWESNGGTVYVKSSVNMTVYGMNFNILRTHKSKN